MDRLIKSLPVILKAAENSDEVAEAACIAAWKFAAGQTLANHAVAVKFFDGKLLVVVAETLWQKQLQSLLGQLIFRMNSVLGQHLVNQIELRVDSRASAKSLRLQDAKNAGHEMCLDQVPAELLIAGSEIIDADLRQAFLGAAMSCLKRLQRSEN